MKKYIILLIVPFIFMSSCKVRKDRKNAEVTISDYKLARTHAVLFHQYSSEYKALSFQAFNAAKLSLENDLQNVAAEKQRIVILDIDETVLNNSPYEAECIKQNVSYPALWENWVKVIKAEIMPGALEFIHYATANNVKVYFVTNRKEQFREPTLINLRMLNIPIDDDKYLIMREEESSKQKRRKALEQEYHISLLIGDNLNDFSEMFETKDNTNRDEMVLANGHLFGSKFILTPNCLYGQWEQNLKESIASKDYSKFVEQLKGFIEK